MICFFNGQDSQPIQPLLLQAAPQVGLNEFKKGSLGCCHCHRCQKQQQGSAHLTEGGCYGVIIHNQHLGKLGV